MTRPIMADLVEETTTTDGTSDFVLLGAKTNRQAFSVLGATAAEVHYRVDFGSEWAIYRGSYTDATKTLTRDAVLSSSNSGSEVTFSAGTKSVLLVVPADFLNKLAGHGIPAPSGDATTPGVSIGEDGSGIYYLDGSPSGSKAICFSIDTSNNARFYHAADRETISVGWTFAGILPGYVGASHDYSGAVINAYDADDAHVILQAATTGLVMSSSSGGGHCYRIQTAGSTFSVDKLITSTGVVDKTILSTTNGLMLTVGTDRGVEAANLGYSNTLNAHLGFNAGENLTEVDAFYNVVAGYLGLNTVDICTYCTALGCQSMQYSDQVTENSFTLTKITMAGALSGRYHHGADSVGVGYRAVGGTSSATNSTGARHVGVGSESLNQLTTGVEDTCLGYGTGNQLTTGSGVVYVGHRAGEHLGNVSDRLAIGNGPTAGECWIIGDASYNVTFAADVTLPGALTVAGINVINYTASVALVASSNASAISTLNGYFSGVAADDTYETGGGDQFTFANGLLTGFTAGSGGGLVPHHVGHRLTPSASEPYVTSDDTGNTVLHWLPYRDNLVRIYTGSAWVLVAVPSLSFDLDPTTGDVDLDSNNMAASSAYDAFLDYNGGTPQLAVKKWTSGGFGSSARAIALTRQDGVLVLTGNPDHLYLGSFYLNASIQLDLSENKLGVWNYYNQEIHRVNVFDDTSHSYNGPFRAWNNDTSLRVEFILGQKQNLEVMGNFAAWVSSSRPNHGGIQLDATTGTPVETIENRSNSYYRNAFTCMVKPGEGNHYLQCVEGNESAGGGATFYEARLDFGIMA